MGAEENIATLREIVDAINRRDLATVAAKIAPGFVRHDLASLWTDVREAAGVRDFLSTLIDGVPDLRLDIEQIWGNEDRVAMWIRMTGKHTGGELVGVAQAGAALDISSINLYRFDGGKVAETWQLPDAAGLMRQLGVLD